MNPDILATICDYIDRHIPIKYVHPLRLNTSRVFQFECLENKSVPLWLLTSFKRNNKFKYWYHLGKNTGLPIKFIEDNIDGFVSYNEKFFSSLCQNPSVPLSLFEKNLDKLDWSHLSKNPGLTTEFIEKYKSKLCLFWLSSNPCIPMWLLEKYKNKIYVTNVLDTAPLEFIEKYFLHRAGLISPAEWRSISMNPHLTINFIKKYYDNLNWTSISSNISVPLSFLIENKNKIDWKKVSKRSDLTSDFIEQYKDKLDWDILNENKYLPIELINKDLGYYFWKCICSNVHVIPEILLQYQTEYEEDYKEEYKQPSYFLCNEILCEKLFRENIKLYLEKYC